VEKAFGRLWPELEAALSEIPKATGPPPQRRATDEYLEEIPGGVRSALSQVERTRRDPLEAISRGPNPPRVWTTVEAISGGVPLHPPSAKERNVIDQIFSRKKKTRRR
jgi:hypothetical protein